MRCPKCQALEDKVIDSRPSQDGATIRRRRECLSCGFRFTTYEEVDREDLRVIKRDLRYEIFDRRKLLAGLLRACEKRPISREQIEQLADHSIEELAVKYHNEIPTSAIGERLMQGLRQLDKVAYVRFASVYRKFQDLDEFQEFLEKAQTGQSGDTAAQPLLPLE